MKKVTLYTDGACSGNPGPGGWGAVLLYGPHRREMSGGEQETTNNRMELTAVIEGLRALCAPPDAVYLDPMFPARQKSAAVKKKFQLLHRLERPCDDAEELLRAALDAHPRKVVVKRPPKGPCLAGVKPSYSIAGKAVRYDVIALAPSA